MNGMLAQYYCYKLVFILSACTRDALGLISFCAWLLYKLMVIYVDIFPSALRVNSNQSRSQLTTGVNFERLCMYADDVIYMHEISSIHASSKLRHSMPVSLTLRSC